MVLVPNLSSEEESRPVQVPPGLPRMCVDFLRNPFGPWESGVTLDPRRFWMQPARVPGLAPGVEGSVLLIPFPLQRAWR